MTKTIKQNQKEIEAWFLDAARRASEFFPDGDITVRDDQNPPDFTIGTLGIEVTELCRPAPRGTRHTPVAEEAVHTEIVRSAEQSYRATATTPVEVHVRFLNGVTLNKRQAAHALTALVKAHRPTDGVVSIERDELPEGFLSITIASWGDEWANFEGGGTKLSEICEQLAARIRAKNELLHTYRAKLPNKPIWLLIYSGVAVSRGVPIPANIQDWKCPFDFDRVLFFSCLDNEVVEIQRGNNDANQDSLLGH